MASVYQLGFLAASLLTLCQAEKGGRVDCRLYPYAPKCRGIMTRKNFHGGEFPIDPAGFPDSGMWSAAGVPAGSRVVQGGLAARAYTPETDYEDDAEPGGAAAGKPPFWEGNVWGGAVGMPPFWEDKLFWGTTGKPDFSDDGGWGAAGKPDDGGLGAAGEPIGRRVVKGGIRTRATDKFL